MSDNHLLVNGIDIETGGYLDDNFTYQDVVREAKADNKDHFGEDEEQIGVLKANIASKRPHRGAIAGVDPKSLAQCGWGIVLAEGDLDTDAILKRLEPLLTRREAQAGDRFKKYVGRLGYRKERQPRADQWLELNGGSAHDDVNPKKIPYYLMLVGSPTLIPFRFQYELDVKYAVGRIHFDDIDDYGAYAKALAEVERREEKRSKSVVVFAPRNAGDSATARSADSLAKPVVDRFTKDFAESWKIHTMIGEGQQGDQPSAATKANLQELLKKGGERPAFLFTASHGSGMRKYNPTMRDRVGALICQDWPGKQDAQVPVDPAWCFGAADITGDLDVKGLISFHFACFGAGAPEFSIFSRKDLLEAKESLSVSDFGETGEHDTRKAPEPFIARLPQRLLAQGGALAAVGHVDAAFPDSFSWNGKAQTEKFHSVLNELANGFPVGHAMDRFNQAYLSKVEFLFNQARKENPDPETTAECWTATWDARNYIVVGDPAVRLNVARPEDASEESAIASRIPAAGAQADAAADGSPTSVALEASAQPAAKVEKFAKTINVTIDGSAGSVGRVEIRLEIEIERGGSS